MVFFWGGGGALKIWFGGLLDSTSFLDGVGQISGF